METKPIHQLLAAVRGSAVGGFFIFPMLGILAVLLMFKPADIDRTAFAWDVVACAAYDLFRLPSIHVFHLWGDFFGRIGGWAPARVRTISPVTYGGTLAMGPASGSWFSSRRAGRAGRAGAGQNADQNLARIPSATSSGLRSISASPYRRSK